MANERSVSAVDIDRLISSWERRGHKVDPRQYATLNDLLMTVIARGETLNALKKTMIAPLFCSTPAEQHEFHEVFEGWYAMLGPLTQTAITDGVMAAPKAANSKGGFQFPKVSRTALLWILGGGILAAILVWLSMNSGDTIQTAIQTNFSFIMYAAFILSFFALAFIGWRIWVWIQENQYISRELSKQEPIYTKLPVKGYIQEILPVTQIKPVVSTLRRRTQVPSTEVDVNKTIEKALNQQNWLEVVYRQRQVMPEYVVLIDRKSRFDQQARFVQEVLARLATDGVWLHQYEFSGDPQVCFPVNRKDMPLRLKDLQTRHPDSRLLVFSGTKELLHPLTGHLQDWLKHLFHWQERAILTPDKLDKVLREDLEAQDFAVLPLSIEGLASLVRAFETDHAPILTINKDTPPIQLLERPVRWTGRNAPPDLEVQTLITDIKKYLGEEGFYWLCATAVYPELRWELTLHLGNMLNLLNTNTFMRIARLPWFRIGYMPDWFRQALILCLTPQQEISVRKVLSELLATAFKGSDFDLKFSYGAKNLWHRNKSSFFDALLRNSPPTSKLRDDIFVKFIAISPLRKLAVNFPKPWKVLETNSKNSRAVLPESTKSFKQGLPKFTSGILLILTAIGTLVDGLTTGLILLSLISPTSFLGQVLTFAGGIIITGFEMGTKAVFSKSSPTILRYMWLVAVIVDFYTTIVGTVYYVALGYPLETVVNYSAIQIDSSNIFSVILALGLSFIITGSSVFSFYILEAALD